MKEDFQEVAGRWRSPSLTLAVVLGVGLAIGVGFVDFRSQLVAGWLDGLRAVWWSPLAVTLVFTLLAFCGAPQVVLIAGTVAVFGAWQGAGLSWVATMISASVGFWLGRLAGGDWAKGRVQPSPIQPMLRLLRKQGVASAFLVRLVPTGPFVLVNTALGASGQSWRDFLLGTGVGIMPKIGLVAGIGHGLVAWISGQRALAVWVGLAAMVALLLTHRLARARARALSDSAAE